MAVTYALKRFQIIKIEVQEGKAGNYILYIGEVELSSRAHCQGHSW